MSILQWLLLGLGLDFHYPPELHKPCLGMPQDLVTLSPSNIPPIFSHKASTILYFQFSQPKYRKMSQKSNQLRTLYLILKLNMCNALLPAVGRMVGLAVGLVGGQ